MAVKPTPSKKASTTKMVTATSSKTKSNIPPTKSRTTLPSTRSRTTVPPSKSKTTLPPLKSKTTLPLSKSKTTLQPLKSKTKLQSLSTSIYSAESPPADGEDKRPRWVQFIDRNANPKNHFFPRPPRELTRWQKRGPMSRKDWARFYHWASENAVPRPDAVTLLANKDARRAKRLQKLKKPEILPRKTRNHRKVVIVDKRLSEVFKHLGKLSAPKTPRKKYERPEINYPYAPLINSKGSPKKDPGRPFPLPIVPERFYHQELEIDWWSQLRFQISRSALKHKPTLKEILMSKPRVSPPLVSHCPVPEPIPEIIPKRQRMTYKQWKEHLRRLEYLSKPNNGFLSL